MTKGRVRRIVRVKSCVSGKGQECFMGKRGSRSRKRRSVSRKRRSVSRKRRSVSHKRRSVSHRRKSIRSTRRKSIRSTRKRSTRKRSTRRSSSSGHKCIVLNKSHDLTTQIKNFFKIDQEIIYIIQHPRKAKRENVLKLLSAIILFLLLLCMILKLTGSSYNCNASIDKIKELAGKIKDGTMDPIGTLKAVRDVLYKLVQDFMTLAPVVAILGIVPKIKEKLGNLFKGPIPSTPEQKSRSEPSRSNDVGLETEIKKEKKINIKPTDTFKDLIRNIDKSNYPTVTKKFLASIVDQAREKHNLTVDKPVGNIFDSYNEDLIKFLNKN
jgi:hypothetical protein